MTIYQYRYGPTTAQGPRDAIPMSEISPQNKQSPECAFRDKLKKKVLGTESSSRLQQLAFNSLLDTLGIPQQRSKPTDTAQRSHQQPSSQKSGQSSNLSVEESYCSSSHKEEERSYCGDLDCASVQNVLRLSDLAQRPALSSLDYELFETLQVKIFVKRFSIFYATYEKIRSGTAAEKWRRSGVIRTALDDRGPHKAWQKYFSTDAAGLSACLHARHSDTSMQHRAPPSAEYFSWFGKLESGSWCG